MTIELTQQEFEALLLALGYATGLAIKAGDPEQGDRFLRVANAVNRNNPNWRKYEFPNHLST